MALNELRHSTSNSGASATVSPSLEGVNTGRVVCFSIPKVYGSDTALGQVGKRRRFDSFDAAPLLNKAPWLASRSCW